jgi:hypothetical protein
MATYTKASKSIPSQQRAVLISAVSAGDKIDLEDALGRPARKVIFHMQDPADEVTYKINHLRRLRAPRTQEESYSVADQVYGVFGKSTTSFWAGGNADIFTGTGAVDLETVDGLEISSLEIVTLATGSPNQITITVT